MDNENNQNIISNVGNDNKKEISTKEKILDVAIDLFSSKGYKEVSIREIAKHVGIKDASIYYHYSKKEDILDSIFEYFIEKMNKTEISKEQQNKLINQSPMKLYHFGSEAIKYQFNSIKMIKIMRLMFIEMYHNKKIRDFFQNQLIDEPINFWTLLFKQFMNKKIIKQGNPKELAENYYYYSMFKVFQAIILKYPDDPNDIDLDPIFDNMEKHFYNILDSNIINKKDKGLIQIKDKYLNKNNKNKHPKEKPKKEKSNKEKLKKEKFKEIF